MHHENKLSLEGKLISGSKSVENIWDRWKVSNSLGRFTERLDNNDSLPRKKKIVKGSSNSSEALKVSTSFPNLFEVISPRNEKWIIVQEALTGSLLGKTITNLSDVLICVRELSELSVTKAIVEFYEVQILRNTLHKMQKRMTTTSDIADCWVQFYRKSLPNINLIFSSLKIQQELIENISFFEFKRRVVKIEDLQEKIINEKGNRSGISMNLENMVLILLPIRRKDGEYSDVDAIFEETAALLISPLIGCRGMYINGVLNQFAVEIPVVANVMNSFSKGVTVRPRKSLQGLFYDSKSLLDISGDF